MKIYFEDGELNKPNSIDFTYDYKVDARYGHTKSTALLSCINCLDNDASVYTNAIIALDNKFAWNNKLKVPEIYLIKEDNFIRIDKLTDRELKEGHDIMKMYMNGEFDN
jgi:hypothetical protein